jgi:hypothetical protein
MQLEIDAQLDLSDLNAILERRGLTIGGRVQKVVDVAVLRYCDPKVPFNTGMLKDSAITASAVGEGLLVYATPYARRLFYHPEYNFQGAPDRGAYWFERTMAEHKDDVVREAAAAAGGRPGR